MFPSLGLGIYCRVLQIGQIHRVTLIRGRRRTLTPAPWICPKEKNEVKYLKPDERAYLEQVAQQENLIAEPEVLYPKKTASDLARTPEVEATWTQDSKRVGLLATKIGMAPQWLNDGTRVLCTLLHVQQNHVVSAVDPDTWFKQTSVGKRKAFGRFGPMWKVTVGAIDANPAFLSHPYRRMFDKVGIPCKDKLASFLVTENAVVSPGTRLEVRHFTVGQFVNVSGKTIDWGFQGVMHRWGMRGQPSYHTTKSHRRVGSIGSTGDARVWPGKRLPGHMGYEWRLASGLEVMRINPVTQVIYVKGCVPGDHGELLLINDCWNEKKEVKEPPFPTFVPEEGDDLALYNCAVDAPISDITAYDIYHPKLFRFTSPSIVYTEEDETKSAAREKGRAKIAKVKKVCRQWNTIIETADRELWHTFALAEIPEAGLNDSDLFPRGTSFKHRLRAFRYAWNPQDSSRNNFLRTNGFTVHRQPIAQSTDAIRGKIGVSTGVHAYNITWKGPLGTVAVVGVATKHAALHCPGYVALLGSDDQSWGWNLVDNTLLYNGNCVGSYPRLNNPPKYQVGEKITMILDRDTETLFFEKNGEFFGIAFENIPPVKLFPAICAVYGNTEVSMAYAGTPLAG
ncbi:unnamed protein product [Bursaphelenchus xylophilus]|uniref:Large ribosomal subunit protein uL3m n=2 Tax=Bursaphelenchus xylophilus TaxID=6326 RepID=A0A7I8WIS1_BURXY|nr:unnamed protein product [Bursaphelenchus xylophilus]CAG9108767.1 unnamed protein product [Bursaphelenchus xylophilus]